MPCPCAAAANAQHEPPKTQAICADRTTQIDVILHRVPRPQLFVFHRGDDPALHVKWDRLGNVRKSALPIE